ncbi:MAG: DUF4912 domain-containing protein, partial [Candidatus Omnitrophica bacterium]|nr:DUF4912 domain-containing protein [Candidatus Omnitrophota bacterium]
MKKIFKKIKEKLKTIKQKTSSKRKRARKKIVEFEQRPFPQETKVEETKYYTPPFIKRYPTVEQLPQGYGEDRLVVQTRDPWWIHAYWELTPKIYEKVMLELIEQFYQAKKVLRVY